MRPTPVHHAMLAALQCTHEIPQKRGGRVVITAMKQHPSKLDCGGAPHWQPCRRHSRGSIDGRRPETHCVMR